MISEIACRVCPVSAGPVREGAESSWTIRFPAGPVSMEEASHAGHI